MEGAKDIAGEEEDEEDEDDLKGKRRASGENPLEDMRVKHCK